MSGTVPPSRRDVESTARSLGAPPPPETIFAGRYEIRGVVGGGAMGTVYRAKDRALDETVALKLLKKELAVSPELVERFRREVRLARRVTHRNVARVFDIGAHGQQPFLTMELVDGVSLAEILARRGSLPPREVYSTATSLCSGLAAAHAAGVVHRDLKPENVLVEQGGRVIITDFGVACALTERDMPYGAPGALVGSPAYMAPEQVEGLPDPDARADIYALGVMLYEVLTGTMPWDGGSVFAVASARLVKPPPDPRLHSPEVPGALAEVVLRCMATKRDDRYATVEEVVAALAKSSAVSERISIPPPTQHLNRRAGGRAVAVLPLVNSLGPELDYFARGYVSELIDLLGALPGLAVRHAEQGTEGARDVARSLGAQAVVSGSLEKTLTGVRLTAQIVTVEDGLLLWQRRSDAPAVVDLALVVREHALEIARVLDSGESKPVPSRVAGDPQAMDLHMRGRLAYTRAWFEANEQAVQLLEMAHVLAPADAGISATLALALARAYGTGGGGQPAADRARTLAEGALESAPQLADARVALAALHAYDCEGVAAASDLRRALGATPDAIEALDWIGRLLVEVGEPERGLAYLDRAFALDPMMLTSRLTATLGYALIGDFARVKQHFGAVPNDPADRTLYYIYRARIAIWRQEPPLPLPDLSSLSPTGQGSVMAMFHILNTRQIEPHVRGLLEQMLPTAHSATVAPRRAVLNAQFRAELLAHAGLLTEAATAIRDADATGLADIVWLERCPALAPLRALPDFARIQRNVSARATRIRAALGSR